MNSSDLLFTFLIELEQIHRGPSGCCAAIDAELITTAAEVIQPAVKPRIEEGSKPVGAWINGGNLIAFEEVATSASKS